MERVKGSSTERCILPWICIVCVDQIILFVTAGTIADGAQVCMQVNIEETDTE